MQAAVVFALVIGLAPPDFEREVVPVLAAKCLGCHNKNESNGDLSLQSSDGLKDLLSKTAPEKGELFRRIHSKEMPPKDKGKPLTEKEIQTLLAWIKDGALWPTGRKLGLYEKTTASVGGLDWWSLQPIKNPTVPPLPGNQNPIDAFVQKAQSLRQMTPAPEADKRTLIRRLSFDLLGLPPSFEDTKQFEEDKHPEAYGRLVDRLLADPRFGERWARHWLDLIRYGDTNGYERDGDKAFAWKYRDYVIRSINADKPYDRFLIEQMAGDQLPNRTEETLIATGMLRVGTWDDEPNDKLEYTYDRLEDMVHVSTTAFLAMSVKCARCHDHKFDPIPQEDYHKVAAAFWPGDLVGNGQTKVDGFDVLAWTDLPGKPKPLHLLKKGDPRRPGPEVGPGFVSMIPALETPTTPIKEVQNRRLELAKNLAHPNNPLTARVAVNRIWQQHFGQGIVRTPDNFGFKGDLPSHPELLDFLAQEFIKGGWKAKPIHRLILTSATYRQSSIHPREADFSRVDSLNRFLWKANRHRLDAEALRDSLLSVGGGLDTTMFGPGITPTLTNEALEGLSKKAGAWQPSPLDKQRRRSIYIHVRRSLINPLLGTFDFADTSRPCAQRDVTLVAPQALMLLNDGFVHAESKALAQRVSKAGTDPKAQIQAAWRMALGRDPTPHEVSLGLDFLARLGDQEGLRKLCHVLVNTNEFVYVD